MWIYYYLAYPLLIIELLGVTFLFYQSFNFSIIDEHLTSQFSFYGLSLMTYLVTQLTLAYLNHRYNKSLITDESSSVQNSMSYFDSYLYCH